TMASPLRPKSGKPNLTQPLLETSDSSTPTRGRTIGLVSILTLVVAAFGYFREATLAARFGVSATMDSYLGALYIPNVVYSSLSSRSSHCRALRRFCPVSQSSLPHSSRVEVTLFISWESLPPLASSCNFSYLFRR